MSYFIKGNKERGPEVIKLLESKGGINSKNLSGKSDDVDFYYFIDKHRDIDYCINTSYSTRMLKSFCEELTLHEKWVSQYNIGDKIQTLHTHKKGTIINIDSKDKTYRISFENDIVVWCNEDEIELYKWSPIRGERVLVRNCEYVEWEEVIFSFMKTYSDGCVAYHSVGGNKWNFCIPFDENKLGKVTED